MRGHAPQRQALAQTDAMITAHTPRQPMIKQTEPKDIADSVMLRNVTKSYLEGSQRRVIYQHIDASFAAGEVTAIVGPSGSGKSTLLNIISGVDRADAGEVWIAGHNLSALDEYHCSLLRRRHVGFVFQAFNLIPTLTVEENVSLPLAINGEAPRRRDPRVLDMLRAVDLESRSASFPDALSGGEQQRVAIARAIVHHPAVVLADEPTGNLDAAMGQHVLALLFALARERRTTLLIVTHSSEVAARADRVLRVVAGRLQLVGEAAS